MQIELRKIDSGSHEETVIECDRRGLGRFLLMATVAWLLIGAWLLRETLLQMISDISHRSSLAIWTLSGTLLAVSLLWVAFGRRTATFVAGELRVRSFLGPFRLPTSRTFTLRDIRDIRLWLQGVNDGGWRTTRRAIVFDYCGRMIVLFPDMPEQAAEGLLDAMRALHAEGVAAPGDAWDAVRV